MQANKKTTWSVLFMALALFLPLGGAKSQCAANYGANLFETFPNGFRYVVKENQRPSNRINFRLVMAVGSLQEKEGEEGVAHFIEHLAFRNTTHFPNGGIVKKLETMGEKYGVTINAYTGYDRTVYMFSVPSDAPGSLELGVTIAHEWLSHISFDTETVEKEKPIIFEEISQIPAPDCFDRLKKGSDTRLHRFPVGTAEQVQRITPEILTRFYRRNYQPQHASLIIAGAGIDKQKAEKLIKKAFEKTTGNTAKKTTTEPLQYNQSNSFETCADETKKTATIEWIYPVVSAPVLTTNELIAEEKQAFVLAMLNTHLRKKGSTLRVSKNWYLNQTEHLCLEISANTDTLLLARFAEGISIVEALRQNGFSEHEQKMQLKTFLENRKNRNESYTSEQWCDYFTDILLTQSRYSTTAEENQAITQAITNTTSVEWRRCASELLRPMTIDKALVGYRFAPARHNQLSYSELTSVFETARRQPDTTRLTLNFQQSEKQCPYAADFLHTPIAYNSDSITSKKVYKELGVTELFLKNGARLILKPTANTDSVVSAHLVFQGGLSEIPKEQYPLLESAAAYMSIGGIEGIDTDTYTDVLAENNLSIIHTMEPYWHGIMASASSDKMAPLANLIFLQCFSPEKCYADFEEIKADLKTEKEQNSVSSMSSFIAETPERALRKRVDELAGNASSAMREATTEDIHKLNLDTIAAFYNRIYTRSNGLTCIVTGNFDTDTAIRIFTGMLNRFQAGEIAQHHVATAQKASAATTEKVAEENQPDRFSFDCLYRGDFSGGLRQILILKLMRELIRSRVILEIRNNAGLIYSPYVDLYYHTMPSASFCIDINGTISAENAIAVKEKIEEIMLALQTHQPLQSELDAIKQSFLQTKASHLSPEEHANWKAYLSECVKEQIDFSETENYETILKTITPEDVFSALQKWIKPTETVFLHTGNMPETRNHSNNSSL